MKNKQTQSTFLFIFFLCLSLAFLGFGCGGGSLTGTSGNVIIDPGLPLSITGKAFFYERQVYGNIPIVLKDLQEEIVAITTTDTNGNYLFTDIPPGSYYVSATTGESEVTFGSMVQVTEQKATELNPTKLLCVNNVKVDQISSNSFHIEFDTNQPCKSTLKYTNLSGIEISKNISNTSKKQHELTISGLNYLTNYKITVNLTGVDGQIFELNGLTAQTTSNVGCTNISVNINDGAFETFSQSVSLDLTANNCNQMRISESNIMEDAKWVGFSNKYTYNFTNTSPGIKRIYVQFLSKDGVISPILTDSIVYTSSGYVGVWINDGEALTNQATVQVKAIYPNATHMIIADNPEFTNSFWENYISVRKWNFDSVEGIKHIYCKFKGGGANPDEIFTSSIVYDNTPPKVDFVINNGVTSVATSTVTLRFISANTPPTQMKITNTNSPTSADNWIPFQNTLTWSLPYGDGEKTVYALFRDNAGNEYGPISAGITIDTIAPSGNTVSVRESDNPNSTEIETILTDKLPAFLHFNITDTTTYKIHYYIGLATSTVPTKYTEVYYPTNPIVLDNLPIGTVKVWALFEDEAGNKSVTTNTTLTVEGPEIILSPSIIGLRAGEAVTFKTSFSNIDEGDVVPLRWNIATPTENLDNITELGKISQDGSYVAPNIIWEPREITIRANSRNIDNFYGVASISLQATTQIVYLQENGSYTVNQPEIQIPSKKTATFNVYVIGSDEGVKISSINGVGTASVSVPPAVTKYGSIATITYYPPEEVNNNYLETSINIQTYDMAKVSGRLNVIISDGANLTLSSNSETAQHNTDVTITATVLNTDKREIEWEIDNPNLGSFDQENTPITATTTKLINNKSEIHFYAPDNILQSNYVTITAKIDGVSKNIKLRVDPPLSLDIVPKATDSMPLTESIILTAVFNFKNQNTDETLEWFFKNRASSLYMPADGLNREDRGALTVLDNNHVQYTRPQNQPSDIFLLNYIDIEARSTVYSNLKATASIHLSDKVEVKIYTGIEKDDKLDRASSTATVFEVGSLQFYVKVIPETIDNTSVTWTVNGVTNSESYGSIDSNGKYTAPSNYEANRVVVKATSNYDPSASDDIEVRLTEFWKPTRTNMTDENTKEYMPITKVFTLPNTDASKPFIVYAGAGSENGYYGLWVASFSSDVNADSDTNNASDGYWIPINNLYSKSKIQDDKFFIYDIGTRDDKIYAATGNGIYYISKFDDVTNPNSATRLTPDGNNLSIPVFSIDTAKEGEKTLLICATNEGIYKLTLSNETTIEKKDLLIDSSNPYYTKTTRSYTTTDEPPKTENITAYCDDTMATANPISSQIKSVRYDNINKTLYFGTLDNSIYYCNQLKNNIIFDIANTTKFSEPAPSVAIETPPFIRTYRDLSYPRQSSISGVPLSIALDTINTNTIWCATTEGVSRSINYGQTWTQYNFGGVNTNARCVIVDPNNTINVMAGSEDGLYRTVDGGTTWTRIRSGLGNYKTITSLTQSSGKANERRKVWIGTSGGVFVGRQSLSLD